MLRRVLYTSRAAQDISLRDVYDIIRVANNRNSQAGLTGGLIFIDGYFIQLLEGIPCAVEECLARITNDKRHFDIDIRLEESAVESLFPTDWMALRDGSQIDPQVLKDHTYLPGMSAETFSPQDVLGLLMSCFGKEQTANDQLAARSAWKRGHSTLPR